MALSSSVACSNNICGSKMPMESSSAEPHPEQALLASSRSSDLAGLLWICGQPPCCPYTHSPVICRHQQKSPAPILWPGLRVDSPWISPKSGEHVDRLWTANSARPQPAHINPPAAHTPPGQLGCKSFAMTTTNLIDHQKQLLGRLMPTCSGRAGGVGGRRVKRSGCTANASSSTCWRAA